MPSERGLMEAGDVQATMAAVRKPGWKDTVAGAVAAGVAGESKNIIPSLLLTFLNPLS